MKKSILRLTVNGRPREDAVPPNMLLVDYLREAAKLTGAKLGCDGGNVSEIRVGLTGLSSNPFLLAGTDKLAGKPLDDAGLEQLVGLVPKQIQPMTSSFTPPGYRRKVTANVTRALAARLFADARPHLTAPKENL